MKSLLLLALLAGTVGWGQDGNGGGVSVPMSLRGQHCVWQTSWYRGKAVAECKLVSDYWTIPDVFWLMPTIEPFPSSHRRIERIEVEPSAPQLMEFTWDNPRTQPMDVPAINKATKENTPCVDRDYSHSRGSCSYVIHWRENSTSCVFSGTASDFDRYSTLPSCVSAPTWTCADPHRTDESGGKHCIKFGGQP